MLQGLHATVIGDSHVRRGIVCQDCSGHYVTDHFGIAVVADGHGSEKHFRSEVVSRLAVKITTGLLDKYMGRPDFKEQFQMHPDFILAQMEKQILMKWREAVEVYHQENPLSREEADKLKSIEEAGGRKLRTAVIYGSTVLAAVIADGYSFGLVLGDGGFVVLDRKGRLFIPVEDRNSHANYTSSLCNTDAVHYFEHWYSEDVPSAVFVSTDGLYKSFASDADFLRYHGLLAKMLEDEDRTLQSLERNFEKRTREGSGDDISIALIYRSEDFTKEVLQ